MSSVVDSLKRKEQVEEDLYFARRDRELLAALYQQRIRPQVGDEILIVSGGQTGVDRAALDAALALGLPIGGWCPRGRRAEDGPLAPHYRLLETPLRDYRERTVLNIRDSDATLILNRGVLSGGTLLTAQLARRGGRPLLIRDLGEDFDTASVIDWLITNQVRALNCAGPRESGTPGIQARARERLDRLFAAWVERQAIA